MRSTCPTRSRSSSSTTGYAVAIVVLVAVAVAVVGCTKNTTQTASEATSSPNTTAGAATTQKKTSTTTDARGGEAPETTAKKTSTTTAAPDDSGVSGGSFSTEGACGLLTSTEIEAATGKTVVSSSPLRKDGCYWDDAQRATVAEIEVEGAGTFDSYKTLYGDPTSAADVAGIGEDAYYNGLNDWVDFRRGGKKYEVRVKQIDDSSRQKAAVVALARSADGRLS